MPVSLNRPDCPKRLHVKEEMARRRINLERSPP
jgi:hypothetical protein